MLTESSAAHHHAICAVAPQPVPAGLARRPPWRRSPVAGAAFEMAERRGHASGAHLAVNAVRARMALALHRAESAARDFVLRDVSGDPAPPEALRDHRAEMLGELLEVLDILSPGVSKRVLDAMYPLSAHPAADW